MRCLFFGERALTQRCLRVAHSMVYGFVTRAVDMIMDAAYDVLRPRVRRAVHVALWALAWQCVQGAMVMCLWFQVFPLPQSHHAAPWYSRHHHASQTGTSWLHGHRHAEGMRSLFT